MVCLPLAVVCIAIVFHYNKGSDNLLAVGDLPTTRGALGKGRRKEEKRKRKRKRKKGDGIKFDP